MTRVADSLNLPTPTIFPLCTATSAVKEGPPEPSTTRPFLMSRSYAMTLPPLGPDASGPLCHLGTYCLYPPCDAPAQIFLWTHALYTIRAVRSIADMPHSGSASTTCRLDGWACRPTRDRQAGAVAHASFSSNTLASCKSCVSNPSVNQP